MNFSDFFKDNKPMRMSYSELKDQDEVICPKCNKALPMVEVEYIHRHDGGNEIETHLVVSDEMVWELYGVKYHDSCVTVDMDKAYGKTHNSEYICGDVSCKCTYRDNAAKTSNECPISENKDVVVLCHDLICRQPN
jgi:hypothetical protein